MSMYCRTPLDPVTQNKEYFTSQSSSKIISSTIRQCTSTTNLSVSQMKRSMSGNNIYSSQVNNPPPARQQLGKSLDIVCFLMACEIERFVAENDKLKYRIKEMDDKLLDRNSYEKQIEDLQARLIQLQYQESMQRQEIEITTTQYSEEIENWKIKYYTTEENYKNQNEQLKQTLITTNQKYQRDIDDLKSQVISQKQSNEGELYKLREQLQNKQQAIDYYQLELNQYESEFQQYKQQGEKVIELENKIGMLVCETERLNTLLKQKLEELEFSKQRYSTLIQESDKQKSDFRQLQNFVEKKQKDYDQLNQAYIISTNELIKYKDQDQIIDQMQNKISQFQGEVDRLNQVLMEKIKQGEEWRQKYFDSENQCKEMKQKMNKLDQLQIQLKDQFDMFQQMSNNLEDQKIKNNQLVQQKFNLEQVNKDLITKIELLTNETERMNNILRLKIQELEDWKQKGLYYEQEFKNKTNQYNDSINKLTCLTQEIDRMQEQLRQKQFESQSLQMSKNQLQNDLNNQELINQTLRTQNEDQKRKYQDLESEYQLSLSKNKKIIEYENTIAMLTQEIERQKTMLQVKNQEFEDQKKQMFAEIQKGKQNLALKTSEAEEWMTKCKKLEQTCFDLTQFNKSTEEKWKQSLVRIILHCSEIDRLTQIQGELCEENEQLNNQVSHYSNQLKLKDDQLYKQLDKINQLQKCQDEEKSKRLGIESQLASLKMYQENCCIEKSKIFKDIFNYGYFIFYHNKEIVSLESIQNILLIYNSKTKIVFQLFNILEQKVGNLNTEIQRLNEQLRSRSGEIEDYRTQIQRVENKLLLNNQELDRINQQIRKTYSEQDEMRKEKEKWEAQYHLLQRQYEEIKQKYNQLEIYKTKYTESENRCSMLATEIERLNKVINNKQDEIDQLKKKCQLQEQQIIQLKQYEENIRILSSEIDRLQQIIDANDIELKQWRLQYADGGAQNRKIQDLLYHFVMQSVEIESLRARVQEKEKEVEEVRKSSLAPYRR